MLRDTLAADYHNMVESQKCLRVLLASKAGGPDKVAAEVIVSAFQKWEKKAIKTAEAERIKQALKDSSSDLHRMYVALLTLTTNKIDLEPAQYQFLITYTR